MRDSSAMAFNRLVIPGTTSDPPQSHRAYYVGELAENRVVLSVENPHGLGIAEFAPSLIVLARHTRAIDGKVVSPKQTGSKWLARPPGSPPMSPYPALQRFTRSESPPGPGWEVVGSRDPPCSTPLRSPEISTAASCST
ncbi:hypothetical protein GCM10010492_53550 [Saccharothrix mutabilis subsp. mutabilis]|uniref:Uncharacterized protein n=1 Tax=Saccharothrix mutabilis subsp. mutabilis TaxID=66855 RepID=A0ABP3DYM6_9PSEU